MISFLISTETCSVFSPLPQANGGMRQPLANALLVKKVSSRVWPASLPGLLTVAPEGKPYNWSIQRTNQFAVGGFFTDLIQPDLT